MSKMDGLRAMREARYEKTTARTKQPATPAKKLQQPVPVAPEMAGETLCGHRAIGGRTCTREKGHEAKSHRYS